MPRLRDDKTTMSSRLDGGACPQSRFALYGASYTCLLMAKMMRAGPARRIPVPARCRKGRWWAAASGDHHPGARPAAGAWPETFGGMHHRRLPSLASITAAFQASRCHAPRRQQVYVADTVNGMPAMEDLCRNDGKTHKGPTRNAHTAMLMMFRRIPVLDLLIVNSRLRSRLIEMG